jgi:hypothetical protein
VKLYAICSPSHDEMLTKHFLPSIPDELRPANVRIIAQPPGEHLFNGPGFMESVRLKMEFLLEALQVEQEPFLFSDVDVRFYGSVAGDLLTWLGDNHMAFQEEGPGGGLCTGFMVCRPAPEVYRLIGSTLLLMKKLGGHDQTAMNELLPFSSVRYCRLPSRYWTYGFANKGVWEPGMVVTPPNDLLVHHANFTMGVDNKLSLLDAVLSVYGFARQYIKGNLLTTPTRENGQ